MAAIVRDTIHSLPLVKSMNAPVSTSKSAPNICCRRRRLTVGLLHLDGELIWAKATIVAPIAVSYTHLTLPTTPYV